MTNRFRDGHRPIGSLYPVFCRRRFRLAQRLASGTVRRFLELLGMQAGELLIDGLRQHASDFVTELLNLCERRILRRPGLMKRPMLVLGLLLRGGGRIGIRDRFVGVWR